MAKHYERKGLMLNKLMLTSQLTDVWEGGGLQSPILLSKTLRLSNTQFIQSNHDYGSSFSFKLDHRRGRSLQKRVCLCLQIPSDPCEKDKF